MFDSYERNIESLNHRLYKKMGKKKTNIGKKKTNIDTTCVRLDINTTWPYYHV